MIDVKQAVKKAFSTVEELMPEDQLHNLALEEVVFDDKRKQWCITLGYDSPRVIKKTSPPDLLFGTMTEETERKYKIFRISARTGAFVSMKIREV